MVTDSIANVISIFFFFKLLHLFIHPSKAKSADEKIAEVIYKWSRAFINGRNMFYDLLGFCCVNNMSVVRNPV